MNRDDIQLLRELLQEELKPIKDDIGSLKTEVGSLKTDLSSLKSQVDENTQILKALEHNSPEINNTEHDKMINDIVHIKGEIENIKDTIAAILQMYGEHEAEIIKLKKKIS